MNGILGIYCCACCRTLFTAIDQIKNLSTAPCSSPSTRLPTTCVCAAADEEARKNYEKYGHPDGQQALNMGVALPEWIFSRDKHAAPVILISLIGICILLPLIAAACYLLRSNKYMGPNNVATETLEIFLR